MQPSRSSDYGAYSGRLAPERDIAGTFEDIIVMIIFTAAGAAIRLWRLGDWSFWADEVFTVQDAQNFPNVLTINPVVYGMVHFVFCLDLLCNAY